MAWLNRKRLFVYSWMIAAAYLITAGILYSMAFKQADQGRDPMIVDFNTYYAISMLLERHPAASAYDRSILHGIEKEAAQLAFDGKLTAKQVNSVDLFSWMYPPTYFLVMPIFKYAPYLLSLALWVAFTLALYTFAVRAAIPDKLAIGLGLAFPATMVNGMFGQNGFLTAALLGMGLALLPRRPVVAGILIGLLSFKPHLGILIPLALLAGGQWRAVAAATATVAAMALVSVIAFGIEPWQTFIDVSASTRAVMEGSSAGMIEGGAAWTLMPTVFAAVRLIGGQVTAAYGIQFLVAVTAAAGVVWAWRQKNLPLNCQSDDMQLKSSVLILGTFLATPFAYSYDLTLLIFPLLWLAWDMHRRGWQRWEAVVVALGFLLPFLVPLLSKNFSAPLGPIVLAWLFFTALRRLRLTKTA